jgi:DNA mismatch endonuclease, patch repair protein
MDCYTKKVRSRIMSAVKSSGNKSTEEKLIILFKKNSILGWRRNYPLFGKPDIVFKKNKAAIFVDGCFWHGCEKHCRIPKSNSVYWSLKISKNISRDKIVTEHLLSKGWNVIRIWEHELKEEKILKKFLFLKRAQNGL